MNTPATPAPHPSSSPENSRLLGEAWEILDREAGDALEGVRSRLSRADPANEHPEWHNRINTIISVIGELKQLL